MKHGRPSAERIYGWRECEEELHEGVHPEVVAARLGEPIAYVLEVADQQGWAVTYQGPTPTQILDAHERSTDPRRAREERGVRKGCGAMRRENRKFRSVQ